MGDWQKILTNSRASLREVISVIDSSALQIALVVNDQRKLLGTITDGDIRRALLKGVGLEALAEEVMCNTPITVKREVPIDEIEALLERTGLRRLPVLDNDGRVVGLALPVKETKQRFENPVILMVGGLGTRLGELTKNTPKPLLSVGGKPILQTIIERFLMHGFYKFYLCVNYKADMIQDFFGDGQAWDAKIEYVHEKERMGTAGALSLLNEKPQHPFFVMNGDLLTKVNFNHFLEFHLKNGQMATMAVREYALQVPFGVVEMDGQCITALTEKPTQRFFVNAGIYVLSEQCLDYVPQTFFDMPSLFQKIIDDKHSVASFPIHEYWADVGRMGDFQRANQEYIEVFEDSK